MTTLHSQTKTLLKRQEIESEYKISCATIYRWIKEGRFPRPVRIGANMVRWKVSDVEVWMIDREATSFKGDSNAKS